MGLRVGIVGLGLIGGSIARALKRAKGHDITAMDTQAASIAQALEEGVIDRGGSDARALQGAWQACEVIFLCTPVHALVQWVADMATLAGPDVLLTDVGSVKGALVQGIEGMQGAVSFIGGHPMAGTEKSGYAESRAHLFENAYYVIVPCGKTPRGAADKLMALARDMGALPVEMSAREHDLATGAISHLPHVVAAALVNVAATQDEGGWLRRLAAGGFRDITRIASSSPAMWSEIAQCNKAALAPLMQAYNAQMQRFYLSLQEGDAQALTDFFESARKYRDALAPGLRGAVPGGFEMSVDVIDQPGVIGQVATLLGEKGINIRNIGVANSREGQEGAMLIRFSSGDDREAAREILCKMAYRCEFR